MSLTALEILRDARERISDPARWTQCAEARSVSGKSCSPDSLDAVCWCLTGSVALSVWRRGLERQLEQIYRDLSHAAVRLGLEVRDRIALPLEYINDQTGHDVVIHVLDEAIRHLEDQ